MKFTLIAFIAPLFWGCVEKPKIEGLWELQKVDVDMIPRGFKPTYLKFERGGSFYVSKEDGDLVGLYQIQNSLLTLSSSDKKWFNTSWKVNIYGDELVLNDIEHGYWITQLRFRKIEQFPNFEEFQKALSGTWELYKTEENGKTNVVTNTFFIMEESNYSIMEEEKLVEQGNVLVDARHRKITFENSETTWDARFVWDELRLENKKAGLTYRLRKK